MMTLNLIIHALPASLDFCVDFLLWILWDIFGAVRLTMSDTHTPPEMWILY